MKEKSAGTSEDDDGLDFSDQWIGKVLGGRFKLTRFIGAGTMGAVYQAYDSARSESIAVKVFYPALSRDPETMRQLRRVVGVQRNLIHPTIVRVFDLHEASGLCWVSMEWVEGQSVQELLELRRFVADSAQRHEMLRWVREVVAGLREAASVSFHLGIKPGNLFFEPSGRVRISDFGFRSCLRSNVASYSCLMTDSVAYQAPEVMRDAALGDARSDQFSLAAVIYAFLFGNPPSGHWEVPASQRGHAARALLRVCARALSNRPSDRFRDFVEFESALVAAVTRSRRGTRIAAWVAGAAFVVAILWAGAVGFPDSILGRMRDLLAGRSRTVLAEQATVLWNRCVLLQARDAQLRAENDAAWQRLAQAASDGVAAPHAGDAPAQVTESGTVVGDVPRTLLSTWQTVVQGRYHGAIQSLKAYEQDVRSAIERSEQRQVLLNGLEEGGETAIELSRLLGSSQPMDRWHENFSRVSDPDETPDGMLVQSVNALRDRHRREGESILNSLSNQVEHLRVSLEDAIGPLAKLPRHLNDSVLKVLEPNSSVDSEQTSWRARFESLTAAESTLLRWTDLYESLPPSTHPNTFRNGLGMPFVPVRSDIWFCMFETRLVDFESFVQLSGYDPDWHWRELPLEGTELSPFLPVTRMAYEVGEAFCAWLTSVERAAGRIETTDRYRLPLPEEWDLAAGRVGRWDWKENSEQPHLLVNGNLKGIEDGYAGVADVGRFPANEHGLYDMVGSVAEWCRDPVRRGGVHWGFLRGFSWRRDSSVEYLYADDAPYPFSHQLADDIGFRVVFEKGGHDE